MQALLGMTTVSQRRVRQACPALSLEHVRDAPQRCVSTVTSPISGLCHINRKAEDSVIAAGGLLWIQAQRLSNASLLLSHCPVSSGPKSTVQKLSSHLALFALSFGTNSWGQGLNENKGWILLWKLADQNWAMLEGQREMPAHFFLACAYSLAIEGNYDPVGLRTLLTILTFLLMVWESGQV